MEGDARKGLGQSQRHPQRIRPSNRVPGTMFVPPSTAKKFGRTGCLQLAQLLEKQFMAPEHTQKCPNHWNLGHSDNLSTHTNAENARLEADIDKMFFKYICVQVQSLLRRDLYWKDKTILGKTVLL